MENNNGKGIFYGVIGVATLIVAIIGATFAYFTATTTSSQYVTGTAATAGLNVSVMRMTGFSAAEGEGVTAETAKYVMVPQLDTALSAAVQGVRALKEDSAGKQPGEEGYVTTYIQIADVNGVEPGGEGYIPTYQSGNACIDAGGSLVCSIYKIVVQNTGSAPITVSGSISFMGTSTVTEADGKVTIENTTPGEGGVPTSGNNKMNHLKWARLNQPANVVDGAYTYADAIGDTENGTTANIAKLNTMPTTLVNYALNNDASEPYQTTADGQKYYYANDAATINQYLYGMKVTVPADGNAQDYVDLLGSTTITGAHEAHFDLIDPTNDLSSDYTTISTQKADGKWYLAAKDNAGDTKVFYIVVWISENNLPQNSHDQGQFTGTVTFNSAEGSGATSTFTEAYAS